MSKIPLPYVNVLRVKGRDYGYYRRNGVRRRLKGEIGSAEFLADYQAVHDGYDAKKPDFLHGTDTIPGSFRALWLAYCKSPEWRALSKGTQAAYRGLIEPILPKVGDQMLSRLNGEWIIRARDKFSATPSKANHFLAVMKLLLNWSIPRGWLKTSPAAGVKRLKHRAASHRVWTNDELAKMTTHPVVGLTVILAMYTGQRLGDVLRMPWNAWDGQAVTIAAQSKTGVRVYIPAQPELMIALNAAPRRAVVICTRPNGNAWTVDYFKKRFAKARVEMGLPNDLHFHGLRHTAGKRLAEAGCTPQEIAAILGHKTLSMVTLYTAQAGQETMARASITKLAEHKRKTSGKLVKNE